MKSLVSEKIRERYSIKKEDDQFGFYRLANNLLEYILDKEFPVTVGVYGKWGSGKSVIANFMEEIGSEKKIKFIRFDVIEYRESKASILSHLIGKIINQTGIKVPRKELKVFKKLIKNCVPELEDVLDLGIGRLITAIEEKILDSQKGYQFIVVIDNLDRLEPRNTILFLEQLKTFFSLDGVKALTKIGYVILCDFSILEKEIREIYGDKFDVRDYLNKLIEIPFYLPSYDPNSGNRLIVSLLNDGLEDEIKNDICRVLAAARLDTPRDIKNFLQELDMLFVIGKSRGHDEESLLRGDIVKVLALQILRVKYGAVFDYLKHSDYSKEHPTSDTEFVRSFYSRLHPKNKLEYSAIVSKEDKDIKKWLEAWDILMVSQLVEDSTTRDLYFISNIFSKIASIVDSATANIKVKFEESVSINDKKYSEKGTRPE